jgi:YQGE family putative transporter
VTQSIGGVISACVLYGIGRAAAPRHRVAVLSLGVLVFFAGAAASAVLFNAAGVLIFIACLVLAKPMLDLGYNPIELRVVDAVSRLENRSEYGYLFNHEFGLFVGRFLGCALFLAIAHWGSGVAALRYAMPVIALVQLISIPVAARILRELKVMMSTGARSDADGAVASHV